MKKRLYFILALLILLISLTACSFNMDLKNPWKSSETSEGKMPDFQADL